jgi:hypothetical protein
MKKHLERSRTHIEGMLKAVEIQNKASMGKGVSKPGGAAE